MTYNFYLFLKFRQVGRYIRVRSSLVKQDIFALAGDSGTDIMKAGQSCPKRDMWSR